MRRSVVLTAAMWAAGTLGATGASTASAQGAQPEPAPRSAMVTAITSAIVIDGALDEPAWRSAPTIGDLTQRQPRQGEAPTERTEVTLLHDADYLYIGVVCYDSEPQRILGSQMARDAGLGSDDRIEILLDTYRDQRNAFYFSTNPEGALLDGLAFSNGQLNNEWDAIWNVKTRRIPEGWVAEFAIPFKSLSFPAGRSVWGFNINRHIQRKLEENRWSAARLELQFLQVSEAGEITNLSGLTQGIGLDVRPFLGGRWLHVGRSGQDTVTGKPGLDMFYNFTPSLKISATVNTDFGDTEVDTRQINLARFSVLFPERRSFFLEDAGVFSFASTGVGSPAGIPGTGAEVFPFFSRQIGLLNGEEVPLDVGVKLTGKAGRTDIGLLDVRTRDLRAVPDQNFFIGRVRQNILEQSSIGAIVTDGHPSLTTSSRTFGADARIATSRFLGGRRNLVISGYGLRSANEGRTGRDWSYGGAIQYPNDKYVGHIQWKEIQENFRPALGFVQRTNVQVLRVGASYNPRPRNLLNLQQMFHDVYYTRFTRADTGEIESWDIYATFVDWHFRSGDSLHSFFDLQPMYERLRAPFVISPGVVLPPAEYRFTRWRYNLTTAARRRLSGSINVSLGNYWSGKAETVSTGLTYRLPPWFTVSFNTNQTFARLPQGNFIARIFSSNVNYAASPSLSFSNVIQFDNLSKNLGWQSRVRWTVQPGNDIFFVFAQGWLQDRTGGFQFAPQDSKVSAKLQYAARF